MRNLSGGLDWPQFLEMLPNLDAVAREAGAIRRKRAVKSGDELLWLCMTYGQENLSLRTVGALSAAFGPMADQSVRYRLEHAGDFLNAILAHLLRNRVEQFKAEGLERVIRLQDATTLSFPGSTGTNIRIHAVFVPGKASTSFEITDADGGESLVRGQYKPLDIVTADQGLAHAKGLHHVRQVGAYCLVRVYLQNLRLNTDELGTRLVLKAVLDDTDAGKTSRIVYVPWSGKKDLKARLIVVALPPEKAALARERLRKKASKKQKKLSPQALRLAGYTVVLTTVPETELSDDEVLQLYRIRWQIELFFKRCKSLLGLDKLQARRPKLVRAFCLAKLIEVAALENAVMDDEKFYNSHNEGDETCSSMWRAIKFHQVLFISSLFNVFPIPEDRRRAVLKALREGKRKRTTAAALILTFHEKINSFPLAA